MPVRVVCYVRQPKDLRACKREVNLTMWQVRGEHVLRQCGRLGVYNFCGNVAGEGCTMFVPMWKLRGVYVAQFCGRSGEGCPWSGQCRNVRDVQFL